MAKKRIENKKFHKTFIELIIVLFVVVVVVGWKQWYKTYKNKSSFEYYNSILFQRNLLFVAHS